MHALEPAWETLKVEFDSACVAASRIARKEVTAELNQFFRRLCYYSSEDEWIGAVRDAASKFGDAFGLFTVNNGVIQLRAQRQLSVPENTSFDAASAHAFAAVIESREPQVALRTASEVGTFLSSEDSLARARLFPIVNAGRTVAILFAPDSGTLDLEALELVAGMAAAVLERHANRSLHAQIAPAATTAGGPSFSSLPVGNSKVKTLSERPSWANLNDEQRGLHIKAQRFSRVAVAQMQLARPQACRMGREQGNLYGALQTEIDRARETYSKHFMMIPFMVDYLHLELVSTAAQGVEEKLGAEYPGQLV